MKKIFIYSMLPALALLASCSKFSNSSIVGTWAATSATDVLVDSLSNPPSVQPNNTTYSESSTLIFKMRADNNYLAIDTRFTQTPYYDSGSYTMLMDKIVITSADQHNAIDTVDYAMKGNMLTTIRHYSNPRVSSETLTINFARQ